MTNQVQCPNCGSFDTQPIRAGSLEPFEDWQLLLAGLTGNVLLFRNPRRVKEFHELKIGAICHTCRFKFDANTVVPRPASGISSSSIRSSDTQHTILQSSEPDRMLAQLERLGQLRTQGLITEAEFKAAKEKLLGLE